MLLRLGSRHRRQAVALDDPIDGNGRRGVFGSNGTRQRGNNAGYEAAQKQSASDTFETETGTVPHGTTPKPRPLRKKER